MHLSFLFIANQQCGMNMGTCFSQSSMDRLLIIGGSIGGVLMLCCLVTICYCITSSEIKESRAEKVRKNHQPLELKTVSHVVQTSPISFSNPMSLPTQTSPTPQLSEYEKGMKYLQTTDELLQRNTTKIQTV